MICPTCKCEYIRGVTQCADCGVALVDTLEPPAANFADNIRMIAIWRGRDPAERARVEESLESAGIPFTVPNPKSSYGSFLPTEPSMEVWIAEANQARARKVLDDLDDRAHPDELTPEELDSLALPESDEIDGEEQPSQPLDLSEHWFEDDAVAEVWSGDAEDLAATLVACLREVGIASHKHTDDGHWHLVVPLEQESRAKEIVREVVEASPPE